jgi:hypothetical protein
MSSEDLRQLLWVEEREGRVRHANGFGEEDDGELSPSPGSTAAFRRDLMSGGGVRRLEIDKKGLAGAGSCPWSLLCGPKWSCDRK